MAGLRTAEGRSDGPCLPATRQQLQVKTDMSIIEAVGVTKSFANGALHVDAVRGIDLTVGKAKCWRSSGPRGSGKSTLLNLLGAIETPTTGHVLFEGTDVASLNDTERTLLRRRRIGFIFQAFNLLPTLTAVENAALPLELDGISEASRKRAGTRVPRPGRHRGSAGSLAEQMSGGEQQRVAVARALVIRAGPRAGRRADRQSR